jgi:hypothetical protein
MPRRPNLTGERGVPSETLAMQHRASDLEPLEPNVLQHPIVERMEFRAHQPRMPFLTAARPEAGDAGYNRREPTGRERPSASVAGYQSQHRCLQVMLSRRTFCDVRIAAMLR